MNGTKFISTVFRILCILSVNFTRIIAEDIGVFDGSTYWEIVLKLETGGPFRAFTMYSDDRAVRHSGNITVGRIDIRTGDHYKPMAANEWSNVEKVKVSIYANQTERAFFVFDAIGSDRISWFRLANIRNSSYTLPAQMFEFNLSGFHTYDSYRTFYVMKSHDGCDNDYGFLSVVEETYTQPCHLDKADATKIFYSPTSEASAVYDIADSLTITIARDDFSGYRYTADLTVLYKVIPQRMKKENGIALCEQDGGRLFRITSLDKMEKVTQDPVFGLSSHGYFMDGSDKEEEGNWKFSNGEPIPDSVVSEMSRYFDNYAGIEYVLELKVGDHGNTFNDLREGENRNILCEIPVSCEHPPSVANGTVADGDIKIGTKRNVTCTKGFTPQPETFITCNMDGEWSGVTCKQTAAVTGLCDLTKVQLSESTVIISLSSSMENTSVELGCKQGFKAAVGNHLVFCTDGEWTPYPLMCEEILYNVSSVSERIKELRSQLRIWNNSTTKYKRTKLSAEDHRLSSKYIGVTLGACVLATVVLLFVLSDVVKLFADTKSREVSQDMTPLKC